MGQSIVEIIIKASNQASDEFKKVFGDLGDMGKEAKKMGKGMRKAGAAITAGVTTPLVGFIATSVMAAARVDELIIANNQLAKAAGYSEKYVQDQAKSVRDMGIEAAASQQIVAKFMTAQLDLANAAGLARVAQDQAVISGENSTETMMRLTDALITGNTQMFRSMNMTLDLKTAYQAMADQLGINVDELTEAEKVQARVNAVMEYGTTITGTYEAAMGDSYKQMGSFKRMINDIAVEAGQNFTPALDTAVFGVKDLLETVMEMVSEGGALEPLLVGWGDQLDRAAGLIDKVNEKLKDVDPALLKTAGEVVGVTAVLGPLLIVGGQAVIWAGKLAGALSTLGVSAGAAAGPVGLLLTALAGSAVVARNQVNEFELLNNSIEDSSETYEDYVSRTTEAAKNLGFVIDEQGRYWHIYTGEMHNSYQMLTEAQWEQAESMEFGAEMAVGYAAMLEHVTETMEAIPDEVVTQIDIETQQAMANLEALQQKMEQDLSRAMEVLVSAQENWKSSLASDLVAGLEEAGVEGDALVERLEAIDQALGTSLAREHRYNVAYDLEMPELLAKLLEDPASFVEEAKAFTAYFMPLEESVISAQGKVDSLQADLDNIAREYNALINVTVTGSVPTGAVNIGAGAGGGERYGRATGGAVYPGRAYRWREFGDEYFIPQERGQVLTQGQAASMGGGRGGEGAIVVNINTPFNFADSAWVERELAPYIRKEMREALRT